MISRARRDRAAFAELYERYVDRVYTFAYYRTGNRALAEDAVSETFLKALRGIRDFTPRGGGFGAWLLRIARNQLLDSRRQAGHTAPLDTSLADPAASPEQQAISREASSRLRQMVADLPPEQKEAVILKYTLELGNGEIAAVLGKSETAVSSLLHRALQNLRKGVRG